MHKKLYKNLYSKRNNQITYPKVNNLSKNSFNNLENETKVSSSIVSKNIKRFLPIISTFIVSVLFVGYLFFNSTTEKEVNLLSVNTKNVVPENSTITTTTTVSTTSTSINSTTTTLSSTTSTSVPIIIENIIDVQKQLKKLGLYSGEINKELNNEAKAALKEFQRLAGLYVDGIFGPDTKAALEKGTDSYIDIVSTGSNNVEVIIYSEEIEKAQKTLKELGLYNNEIDGINGTGTKNAIREFQRLSGLVVDGILGPITNAALAKGKDSYVSNNESTSTSTTIPIEISYTSIGRVPTQNYTDGVNSPVNGLPMASDANNSIVLGIKNDNNVNARPQSGLQSADAVVEVLVEGGMTRFINIFYQSDTTYHGPIRSARPTDPTILKPLGGVLVVSGATGGLIPQIQAMGVPVVTDRRPEFFRISTRKAPHNLYANTIKLKEHALSRGYKNVEIPQPLFPWGEPTFDEWTSNSYLTLSFSGFTRTTWSWNGSQYTRTYYDGYKNKNSDNIHTTVDINGNSRQISTDTVIALFCEPYMHPLQLPSVKTVGEGRAIIAHGGKLIDARWKRGSNDDPFHIIDSNNNILYVPKGKVWISLVPNTKDPSFG